MGLQSKNSIRKGDILIIYTDGASRKNPGHSAISFIFLKDGSSKPFTKHSEYIGIKTNNEAEYIAIIKALEEARSYTRWKIKVYSDSQLVINQINGNWRIKKEYLAELFKDVKEASMFFDQVEFFHVSRENQFIKICDKLCNDELDKVEGKNDNKNA